MKENFKYIDELYEIYKEKKVVINRRLQEFCRVAPSHYFYELVYCILTPQSSAVNAGKAQKVLEENNFRYTDVDVSLLLYGDDYYIRFHKTKSHWLKEMKQKYDTIHSTIISEILPQEKRDWLVENVKGIGYKEATHFLRNIGMNDTLTILDRHILKNLHKYGVIHSLPKTLTKGMYLRIEKKFQQFACVIKISVNELDLLFWSSETGQVLK